MLIKREGKKKRKEKKLSCNMFYLQKNNCCNILTETEIFIHFLIEGPLFIT